MLYTKCNEDLSYAESIACIKFTQSNENKPGYNQYGVPLNVCNGYIHSEHYWAYIDSMVRLNIQRNNGKYNPFDKGK